MKTQKIVCSLCHEEIPAGYMQTHRERETKDIIAYTVELIKQGHPEWIENDPVCQKCWESYRDSTPGEQANLLQ